MPPSVTGLFSIHLIHLSFVPVSKASVSPRTFIGIIAFLQGHLLWVGAGRCLPVTGGRKAPGLLCQRRFCQGCIPVLQLHG